MSMNSPLPVRSMVVFRAGGLLLWKAFVRTVFGVGIVAILAALRVWSFAVAGFLVCVMWVSGYLFVHFRSRLEIGHGSVVVFRAGRPSETFMVDSSVFAFVKVWWNVGGRVLRIEDDQRHVLVPGVAVLPWGNSALIGPRIVTLSKELERVGISIQVGPSGRL
jgi:hypothetical protein